ncbi:MAG: transposase [Candidatus Pacebacteria bacterium]|nr:transposase [Candidatus Paceibacterota bacterium]
MSKNQNIVFTTGEYYHAYNRGVDKKIIFLDDEDFWKFFDCLRDLNNETSYEERLSALGISKNSMRSLNSSDFRELGSFIKQQEKIVEIISYSINPNHFHLILKQLKDNGGSNFMHRVSTSYTNYFNKKYERSGVLFQGVFKKVHIDSNRYLLWLIGYINGNIEIHGLNKASEYPWSSYQAIRKEVPSFLKNEASRLSNLSVLSGLDVVFSQFASVEEFEEFIKMVVKESRTKKEMERYLLEEC